MNNTSTRFINLVHVNFNIVNIEKDVLALVNALWANTNTFYW